MAMACLMAMTTAISPPIPVKKTAIWTDAVTLVTKTPARSVTVMKMASLMTWITALWSATPIKPTVMKTDKAMPAMRTYAVPMLMAMALSMEKTTAHRSPMPTKPTAMAMARTAQSTISPDHPPTRPPLPKSRPSAHGVRRHPTRRQ